MTLTMVEKWKQAAKVRNGGGGGQLTPPPFSESALASFQ